jgi:hypothetical protein
MDPEKKPLAATIIAGSQPLIVEYREGAKEQVNVILVPLSKAGKYIENAGNFSAFVEMACGKDEGWADTLTDDSAYAVDELFRKLNDPRIDRYVQRQTAAVGTMLKMAEKFGASTTSSLTR